MSIHFRPLFTADVAHGYYRGPCPDIEFIVPANPAALAGGRLLIRNRDGKLYVRYEPLYEIGRMQWRERV